MNESNFGEKAIYFEGGKNRNFDLNGETITLTLQLRKL